MNGKQSSVIRKHLAMITVTLRCRHQSRLLAPTLRLEAVMTASPTVDVTDEEIFDAHQGGKLPMAGTVPLESRRDLSIAYTPGVAWVSEAIHADATLATTYTWAGRLVAVVSDGSAVLGLGNIGPAASLQVMEGMAALFKAFAGLDSIPVVLDTQDVDEIVSTVQLLRLSFGAVNLEDISAPQCFQIEQRLIQELDIPVMHDDQRGTAVVVMAALLNTARLLRRPLSFLRMVISGAGAAGVACTRILLEAGVEDIVLLDFRGIIGVHRQDLHSVKTDIAASTNPHRLEAGLSEALEEAEVFIGASSVTVPEELLAGMSPNGAIFALSNSTPEIHPQIAEKYASVVATR